jgi:hypothetical protein
LSACGGSGGFEELMSLEVCDPTTDSFVTEIDHPYLPLPVGHRLVLEGGGLQIRITVLDETETVAGVETRVVEEHESIDGRVAEISRNFFAQARDGTVCYFGEDVDIYNEDGDITSHSGAWRADGERYRPGIFMPGSPRVGQAFQQEVAPDVAEDQSKIVALGEAVEVPAGTFDDTASLLDRNPLDGSEDTKVYARDVGLIVDESAELTSVTP